MREEPSGEVCPEVSLHSPMCCYIIDEGAINFLKKINNVFGAVPPCARSFTGLSVVDGGRCESAVMCVCAGSKFLLTNISSRVVIMLIGVLAVCGAGQNTKSRSLKPLLIV